MNKITLLSGAAALATVVTFASCGGNAKSETSEQGTKSLIVYYSQTGATKQVADLLQQKTGADLESLQLVNPYDGDFQQTIARCQEEMASGQMPELQPLTHQIADYDTIYIGYPVWFGTYAMPIASLVKENDFSGKVVVPFCTFGSGGNTSIPKLLEALPGIKEMVPGYGVRNARVQKASEELDAYLVARGIVAGEAKEAPVYGEQHELSADEQAVFDEACGSYQMPLGTPVSVASCVLSDGTYYLYKVQNGADENLSEIYVVKDNAEGSVAEFTQVFRY